MARAEPLSNFFGILFTLRHWVAVTLLLHALLLAYFQRYGGELEAESLARSCFQTL